MKNFFVLGFLAILIPHMAKADDFDLSKTDQQTHFAVSYGLAMTSTLILEKHNFPRPKSILYGSLITLSAGIAKEYAIDKVASRGDLMADALGTALSAGVVYYFEF